jgi:hypothetical protein
MAFIMTGRPGGDAGVPHGTIYPTQGAEQDAIYRCSQTNLAERRGLGGSVQDVVHSSLV